LITAATLGRRVGFRLRKNQLGRGEVPLRQLSREIDAAFEAWQARRAPRPAVQVERSRPDGIEDTGETPDAV
jgi:hypothetical protein